MIILSTNKGAPMLSYNGYKYIKYRTNIDGKWTWRCLSYYKKKCQAQLRNGKLYKDHVCGDPLVEVEKISLFKLIYRIFSNRVTVILFFNTLKKGSFN
jgi:hypothetical protein